MKVSSLFNLIADSNDLLDFFEGVHSMEQLVSRLERLKRKGTEEMFVCIEGLRATVTTTLDDTLEMSAVMDETDDDEAGLDTELAALESEGEMQNSGRTTAPEDPKNDEPSET